MKPCSPNLRVQKVLEAFVDPVAAAGGSEAFTRQFFLARERAMRHARNWGMGRPDDIASYYVSKTM